MSELTPAASAPGPIAAVPGETVLIVDDSRTMRAIIKMHLATEGYVFAEAATGERALTLARLLRPAAAVIDFQLPGLDGIELAARLQGEPASQRLPVRVVLVTGGDIDAHRDRAAAAGVETILLKPLDPAQLRQTVKHLVGRHAP